MKINKKTLNESTLREEDITGETRAPEDITVDDVTVDDVNAATTAEVTDAVKAAAVEAEIPMSAEKAEDIAQELKTYAKGINSAAWAPLEYENALTKKLDECLSATLAARKNKMHFGCNLLIKGLAGSGKTSIVEAWAKARGLVLVKIDSTDSDLDATLNGFNVDDVTHDDATGKNVHTITRAKSSALDGLDKERSILFLDEFNRTNPGQRALLLRLINDRCLASREFPNMLFTIACINPAADYDPGAQPLEPHVLGRFTKQIRWDSTTSAAASYLGPWLKKVLNNTDPDDPDYEYLYKKNAFALALALKLLNDPRFVFDQEQDAATTVDLQKTLLSQRVLTNGIIAATDKASFLRWVDEDSEILDKDKKMIHDILDSWTPPTVPVPGKGGEAAQDTSGSDEPAKPVDETDFDAVFGAGGTETDTSLFGGSGTTTPEQQAAKVSSAEALARIKAFNF